MPSHSLVPDLHPDLEPLRSLLGTWSGGGRGSYPTIETFDYAETVVFGHVGKPFLTYSQRTTHAADGRRLHAETGYLRLAGGGAGDRGGAELVVSHPTGVAEVSEGALTSDEDGRLVFQLRSSTVAGSATAKSVVGIERDIVVDGDVLSYVVRMAAVGLPMTHHLEATLERVIADRRAT